MVINITGDVEVLEAHFLCLLETSLHLAVKAVPHPFKCDVAVTIHSWRLSLTHNFRKNIINIRHVEVATETQVLCPPIVSAKERMHIL